MNIQPPPEELERIWASDPAEEERQRLAFNNYPDPGVRYRFTLTIKVEGRRYEKGQEILGADVPFGSLCSLCRLGQVERIDPAPVRTRPAVG